MTPKGVILPGDSGIGSLLDASVYFGSASVCAMDYKTCTRPTTRPRWRRAAIPLPLAGLALAASTWMTAPAVHANPAPNPGVTTHSTPGPFSIPVPGGVCSVQISIAGGAGGDALGGNTQGSGAVITMGPFDVSPGQTVEGSVGGGGGNGGAAGANGGGEGSPTGGHRGAGGGGYTEVNIDGGSRLALAGGGGGSGGGHVPEWGHGGNAGVPAGAGIFPGQDGLDGSDGANARPGGGKGGLTAEGGAGGVHPDNASLNGQAGSALQGGAGGNEPSLDGGAGGGGGLFGGGGGASTVNDGVGGAGGGGGSSFVAASAPFISGGLNASGNGYVELTWTMCEYDLAVTKTADRQVYEPGVPAEFTITVTNNGPEHMVVGDTVTVTDNQATGGTLTAVSSSGGSGEAIECDPSVGEVIASGSINCFRPIDSSPGAPVRGLDVGEVLTLTYTQEYSGSGPVENVASVNDRGDQDNNVASVVMDPAQPALDLVKSASPGQITRAGQTVNYHFDVTNSGNIALFNITIDEAAFSGTGTLGTASCPEGPDGLEPGDTITCTLSYTATQADVDAGTITNTATAGGTTPGGMSAVSNVSDADVEAVHAPSLEMEKSSDADQLKRAGQDVTYTFTITNTGNVTLSDLSVTDVEFSGTGTLSPVTCPSVQLAPDDSADCTATYVVTQADVDAGELTNTAFASALAPDGSMVESEPSTVVLKAPAALPAAGVVAGLWVLAVVALALLVAGGVITGAARRRTDAM